jgi:AraC-like DNA-binding protein
LKSYPLNKTGMTFPSGFFQTIILLGAVQGLIVSALLFLSKKNRRPNRFLALLIFLMAAASFNLYGNYINWFNSDGLRLVFNIVPLVVIMPFGPAIYFYTRSSLDPGFRLTKNRKAHFFPVVIDLVPHLAVVIYLAGLIFHFIKNNPQPWGNFIDTYNVYADIPRWMSVTIYLWLSAKYLFGAKVKSNGSLNEQSNNYKWLRQFIGVFLVFQVLWLIYLVPYVIPRYSNALLDSVDWYPIYIPLAIMIYWLGIKGYLVSQQQTASPKKTPNNLSALGADTVEKALVLLKKTMEEDRLFLNPDLNLSLLSHQTGIPQKTISAVLNQHEHKSFNEFINEYRIAAFKERILNPDNNHLTIAGIALECGFNSQATFQRTFKELTMISPSEFRKNAMKTLQ